MKSHLRPTILLAYPVVLSQARPHSGGRDRLGAGGAAGQAAARRGGHGREHYVTCCWCWAWA
ncbi:MAG: hypothetical protein WKG07_48830 [Hymenobacter sp.]